MPTPGGLPKAGDKIVFTSEQTGNTIYVVIERTSSSAPFSVWIRREDNRVISGFRSENLRRRGLEARLSCETGRLPTGWRNYVRTLDEAPAITPEPPENPDMEGRRPARYKPRLEFRVRDAHRYKDPADAKFYGEEVEISMRTPGMGQSQSFSMGDDDLMELCIKAMTYLRDKAEGLAGP